MKGKIEAIISQIDKPGMMSDIVETKSTDERIKSSER